MGGPTRRKPVKSGEVKTRASAATNAVWAIDKELAPKGKLTSLAFFIPKSGLSCRGLGTFPIFPDFKPWRDVLFWGVPHMPNPNLRSWTEADNAKLKSLAGKLRPAEIAAELGRSAGATVLQASKLKVSLSTRRKRRKTAGFKMDPGPAGWNQRD
jgi:hypothetical protein